MKKRQRTFLGLALISLVFLMGFTREYHWPRIKTWLLVEVESLSHRYLPIRILAQELNVDLWPPSVSLGKIQALPQGDLTKAIGPIQIEKLTIAPGTIDLLAGKFQIAKIKVHSPTVNIILKKQSTDSSKTTPVDLEKILSIPLQLVEVEDMRLQARIDQEDLAIQINQFDFDIELSSPQILLNLKTPDIVLKKRGQSPQVKIAVETRLALNNEKLQISSLQIKKGKSFILASGAIDGNLNQQRLDSSDVKARGYFDLPVLREWAMETFSDINLPPLEGELTTQMEFKKKGVLKPEIGFSVSAVDLSVDQYQIGHVAAEGTTDFTSLQAHEISIRNSSGLIRMTDTSIELDKTNQFRGKLHLAKVSIPQLLENIGVPNIPLDLILTSNIPCYGQLRSPFQVGCQGTVTGQHLNVHSGDTNIVKIDQFTADGNLAVDSNKVAYEAKLTVSAAARRKPISYGKSSGVIDYNKGFDIKFESDQLHFSDIYEELAGLSLKGSTAIKGSTRGDSSYGVVNARLHPKDFYLEDFLLGNLRTTFSYEKGRIKLAGMEGQIASSRYVGETLVDLKKGNIATSLDFDYIDARDLNKSIARKAPLPFDFQGTGLARFKVWGPFDIKRLSYDSFLQLAKGAIGKETFETLTVDISSREGFSRTNKFEISKGNARLSINGKGQPDGEISGQVIARKLRIEDSELAQSLGLKVKGNLNFNVNVEGPYNHPAAKIDGILSGMRIAETPLDTSTFQLKIDESLLTGKGSFFGDNIQGSVKLPLKSGQPFDIDIEVNDWDFVPLFGIFNQAIEGLNYQSNARGKISLKSEKGDFWQSTGKVTVDAFELRRGDKELHTKSPVMMIFENGILHTKNFELYGTNSFVKAEVNSSSAEKFDGLISGKFDISLLAFLTPFFEDLRGPSSFSFKIGGNKNHVEVLGSAFLDDGYIKLQEFPHAFENIKADLLISQSKLLLNSLTSNFASGKINANGSVTINGIKDIPTNIEVSASNLKINYPKGVKAQLSANTSIKGKWLPLKVSGEVNLRNGEVSRDFDSFRSQLKLVETNPFLPRLLLEKETSPLLLDLKVNILDSVVVKNSFLDAGFTGAMKVEGEPSNLKLTGKVNSLPNGILKVQKWPFDLNEAFVQFRGQQPMDPLIYAKASGRKDDHDIQFFVQGPLSKAQDEIQLTSSPEKSKEEIVQILAFGAGETDGQAAGQVGQFIGDFLIPPDLKEKFGLGVVYQKEQLEEEGPRDRVGIKGKLGKNFDFTATRDANKESSTEVKAEYKVNKNFSVIGSWEESPDTSTSGVVETDADGNDQLGLDIELKFKF